MHFSSRVMMLVDLFVFETINFYSSESSSIPERLLETGGKQFNGIFNVKTCHIFKWF